MNLPLPSIDKVINVIENPETADDIRQAITDLLNNGLSLEELHQFKHYKKELISNIATIRKLNHDVLLSISQSVEFVPFSTNELQEYIDEDEDSESIYELIYNDSAAFFSEGIIDSCIANVAQFIQVEGLETDFIANNREELIDEYIALDGYEDNNNYWLSNSSVYQDSVYYIAHCIRVSITEYLEEDEYFTEQEHLLDPYYQVLRQLEQLRII